MAELKVKCPNCERRVGTGIAMKGKKSFESSTLRNNSTKCPYCEETITWDKKDVVNKDQF